MSVAISSVLLPGLALAQGQVPGNFPNPVPQGSPLQRELPQSGLPTAPGLQVAPLPPAAEFAPGQTARIGSVTVSGASVFGPQVTGPMIEGLTGPAVPLSRVEQARQDLLSRYRADGYLLTTVSTVLDARGNLRFNVVEGYIADVKLQGDIGPAGTQVLRFLNRLLEERPIRISTLERYLLLATDVPGVTVRSVLRPSTDDPAAVTLVAQVTRKAFDGLLAADNRAFKQTGPQQLLAVGSFNSFSQFGERTEFSILHAFNNTQTFGQAATEFFVGGSGLKVRLYGGAGGTQPSGDLRTLGYNGTTTVFGAQASYPIIRSRAQTLVGVFAFDAIESTVETDIGPANSALRASYDSIRALRAGLDYALQDVWLGGDRTGITNASFRLSQGLTTFGASQNGNLQAGRAGSRYDFFKFSGELSRTQTLFRPWANGSVALFGLVAGQVSNSVLPPAEKFFLGGLRYNRGYYAGEVTGDNALVATAELQLNTTFPMTLGSTSIDVNAQLYGFYDWGETWENQSQDANRRVVSMGGGLRSQLTQHLTLEVEGVYRQTRQVAASSNVVPLKATGVYWRAVTRF